MRLSLRSAILLAVVGLSGLGGLTLTYVETREPAPSVHVRWRPDVTDARRSELEREYLLASGVANDIQSPRSFSYKLLDTRRSNIAALVQNPQAEDTNDIDRARFTVVEGPAPGSDWMWAAYRVPGLRNATVRAAVIAVFIVVACVGIAGIWALWLAPRAGGIVAHLRRHAVPTRHADIFDSLPSPWRPVESLDALRKTAAVALVVIAIGLPIIATWKTFLLVGCGLAILFGVPKRGWQSFAIAAAVVIAVIVAKAMLPRADLMEGHNAFLVLQDGEALERGLPPQVFQSWRARFEALYPAGADVPASDFSWRTRGPVPSHLYTSSSDAIWRPARFTRQVDAVDFHTLGEFRGGFANENEYNFWVGSVRRESMPFFVMYQLTAASVGSRLAWSGQLFWERADGSFDEILHERPAARIITRGDAGHRVYGAFFPSSADPDFRFDPSWTLRLAGLASDALSVFGAIGIVITLVRMRWATYLRALTLFCVGYLVMVSYLPGRTEYLGQTYPPHMGGDDGLVHDGNGRVMAMLVGLGHVGEALKGIESVYWFTPGTRYVRMVEKLIFGDTNHLFALQLALFPIVMFYLVRQFFDVRWTWVLTVVFLFVPVGNFSFMQYVMFARLGYGEAWGSAAFFLGVVLLLRTQPEWGGADGGNKAFVWCGGAALAAAMFIRPNSAPAVAWLGVAYAWTSLKSRAWTRVAVAAAGLGLALWMPLHNWVYGGEFYLISKSGATLSVPLHVGDYVSAVNEAVHGNSHAREIQLVGSQLKGWLLDPGFVAAGGSWAGEAARAVKLLSLGMAIWIAIQWVTGRRQDDPALGVLAVAALMAHAPMLFIFSTYYRYAVLAWDLSVLVLVVAAVRRPVARTHAILATVEPLGAHR